MVLICRLGGQPGRPSRGLQTPGGRRRKGCQPPVLEGRCVEPSANLGLKSNHSCRNTPRIRRFCGPPGPEFDYYSRREEHDLLQQRGTNQGRRVILWGWIVEV